MGGRAVYSVAMVIKKLRPISVLRYRGLNCKRLIKLGNNSSWYVMQRLLVSCVIASLVISMEPQPTLRRLFSVEQSIAQHMTFCLFIVFVFVVVKHVYTVVVIIIIIIIICRSSSCIVGLYLLILLYVFICLCVCCCIVGHACCR